MGVVRPSQGSGRAGGGEAGRGGADRDGGRDRRRARTVGPAALRSARRVPRLARAGRAGGGGRTQTGAGLARSSGGGGVRSIPPGRGGGTIRRMGEGDRPIGRPMWKPPSV